MFLSRRVETDHIAALPITSFTIVAFTSGMLFLRFFYYILPQNTLKMYVRNIEPPKHLFKTSQIAVKVVAITCQHARLPGSKKTLDTYAKIEVKIAMLRNSTWKIMRYTRNNAILRQHHLSGRIGQFPSLLWYRCTICTILGRRTLRVPLQLGWSSISSHLSYSTLAIHLSTILTVALHFQSVSLIALHLSSALAFTLHLVLSRKSDRRTWSGDEMDFPATEFA